MAAMPSERAPDSTLALLRDPYGWIGRRCDAHGSDAFAARLLLQPTICMRGADAARLFYDERRFARATAAPRRLRATLFGRGGVQTLDDAEHAARRALFLRALAPDRVDALATRVADAWGVRIARWEDRERVVLADEVGELLCEAACAWAGVPLGPAEVPRRTRAMHLMIDSAAAVGPLHLRGRRGRGRAERWAARLVRRARRGRLAVEPGTALHLLAGHRDPGGRLLPPRVAAVELLNLLRPTVAVDRFVVFCALALVEHPEWRERLRDDPSLTGPFVQEVRRTAPFFPAVAARVRATFEWRGMRFPAGRRALLDLYGTDHDGRVWDDPRRFRPERFLEREPGPFELVPQGGGGAVRGHRCPGEALTIALMRVSVDALVRRMRYDVPPQDLRPRRSPRAPALPASGFAIARVRRAGPVPLDGPGAVSAA
ncbi:cytochrome P450 [Miltoncostaea marina]|uniref:cytochrome P450 n=1 Tax=Miltoncostaea marina TaxID=2843215 RepID=UPI001C3E1B13|nr:cytochrome P450 [Miltoncostaea marina]